MRTYTVAIDRADMPPARYRVAFADDEPRAIAVTRISAGGKSRPIAISDRTSRAAIQAALAQIPAKPKAKRRAA